MLDQFGRSIEYLRISVTDRCNFRCLYCMPEAGLAWIPTPDILSYDEIHAIVRQLAPLGLSRLRITGGEPTIRPKLEDLIRLLRSVPGIQDISLSTNGVHLERLAPSLGSAGLDRVNISSDSLRPNRIASISRRKAPFDPIRTVHAALSAGLTPVKLNVVVLRGINDDELLDYAHLTMDLPIHIRFIELMPVGGMHDATWEHVVPSDEILTRLSAIAALSPDPGPDRRNGPATYYRLPNAQGTIGLITPLTHTYCGTCNRVRLTASGQLRTCLFAEHEVDLRTPVRTGLPLAPLFIRALAQKPREHALLQLQTGGLLALSQTGG